MSKGFWRSRSVQVSVSRIGSVQVGNGTMGTLIAAAKASKDLRGDEQANTFANTLLAEMCIEPAMSPDVIGNLDDDQLRPLAETALELLDAAKFADWSEPDSSIRKSTYKAMEAHQKEFYERLALPAMKAISTAWYLPDSNLGKSLSSALMPQIDTSHLLRSVSPGLSALSQPVFKTMSSLLKGEFGLSERYAAEMSWSSMSSLSTAIGMIGKSSIDLARWDVVQASGLSAGLLGDITRQTAAAAMALGQFEFGGSLAARALLSTGIDAPYIHTPQYREPELIVIDSVESGIEAQEQELRQRRIRCQDALFELESYLRSFVEKMLASAEGPSWWKRRVPPAIRTNCESRQSQRERTGDVGLKPIQFSYLGELQTIIVKSDNWDESFGTHFVRRSEFETMMGWVSVVRNDADHARYSSNADYLQFMVAANWFHRRMGLDEPFGMREEP